MVVNCRWNRLSIVLLQLELHVLIGDVSCVSRVACDRGRAEAAAALQWLRALLIDMLILLLSLCEDC